MQLQVRQQSERIAGLTDNVAKLERANHDFRLQLQAADDDKKSGADVAIEMMASASLDRHSRVAMPSEKRLSTKMDGSRTLSGQRPQGVQKVRRGDKRVAKRALASRKGAASDASDASDDSEEEAPPPPETKKSKHHAAVKAEPTKEKKHKKSKA